MPEELASQLLNYMEYIKFMYVVDKVPGNLVIKDNQDLIEKIEKGIESTGKGEVYFLEEVFEDVKRYNIRKLIVKNYIVFYRINENKKIVHIERILYGGTDWEISYN